MFLWDREMFIGTQVIILQETHTIVLVSFLSDILFNMFAPNVTQVEAPTSRIVQEFPFRISAKKKEYAF